ncbi:unnamed protein product [Rhizoctonia solani]|uniref:BTB domain-containing protein n=1 Tax=Rhizoctonia solani TaxID=456999 RepID=A0A8H3B106_9AGAM|nr:unnamed protein product [Rhizoctonia solani]
MASTSLELGTGPSISLARETVLPGRVPANRPPPSIKRHSEFYFKEAMVIIQVESTLYKIHKHMLLKSETFSDMFKLPNETAASLGEGTERPIVLQGIAVSDFEALLEVLYASYYSADQSEPSSTLIIPAFRLAKMWNFTDLCAHLKPIAETMFSEVDKIVFAREFEFDQWIVPAHIKLCQRDSPLNSEEAVKVGLSSLLFISRIREEKLNSPSRAMADSAIQAKADAWIKDGCRINT